MRHFTCVQDLGDLKQALNEAFEIKKDRFQFSELGKGQDVVDDIFQLKPTYPLKHPKGCHELRYEHDRFGR